MRNDHFINQLMEETMRTPGVSGGCFAWRRQLAKFPVMIYQGDSVAKGIIRFVVRDQILDIPQSFIKSRRQQSLLFKAISLLLDPEQDTAHFITAPNENVFLLCWSSSEDQGTLAALRSFLREKKQTESVAA